MSSPLFSLLVRITCSVVAWMLITEFMDLTLFSDIHWNIPQALWSSWWFYIWSKWRITTYSGKSDKLHRQVPESLALKLHYNVFWLQDDILLFDYNVQGRVNDFVFAALAQVRSIITIQLDSIFRGPFVLSLMISIHDSMITGYLCNFCV